MTAPSALTPLLPALDQFLEATRRRARTRRLAPIQAKLTAALATGFRAQERRFLAGMAGLRSHFEEAPGARKWEALWAGVAAATGGPFRTALDDAAVAALAAGWRAAQTQTCPDRTTPCVGAAPAADDPDVVGYLREHGAAAYEGIAATSAAQLGTVLTQAADGQWSYRDTRAQLAAVFARFASSRVPAITHYETANAHEAGARLAAGRVVDGGADLEKRWLTKGDAHVEEICADAERSGWIAVNDVFAGGLDAPLAHVACRCELDYRPKPKDGSD